ncbi:cadherin-like domain-containing protein [Maribacter litopenaei]|uniref:Cadherin-like domain-containing protein n=1 Tax=Maribacter litopenaei TaxID=2976127 RepID=A0ABY5Y5C6_9FLAO|nr:cadherin-like domain-containing protein [Maribacter litopenaei]UWX54063.1 cadherin-like domain-containing protein [Maribacter litopenaei]
MWTTRSPYREDTATEIDVLANDTGIPSDGELTVTDPSSGTVTIDDGGTPADITDDTIVYTPNESFNGTDSFEYTVCDTEGNCDTATVTITVGTPPVLDVVDDEVSIPGGYGYGNRCFGQRHGNSIGW